MCLTCQTSIRILVSSGRAAIGIFFNTHEATYFTCAYASIFIDSCNTAATCAAINSATISDRSTIACRMCKIFRSSAVYSFQPYQTTLNVNLHVCRLSNAQSIPRRFQVGR